MLVNPNDALREKLHQALQDRYELEREIGEGGMAVVFAARDVKHDRLVALKVLRPEVASQVGGERFLLEVKTAATLNHPHILSLIDSGEVADLPYYVMPYVAGESLAARLAREKQLSVEAALKITQDVAAALSYAHRAGVIHRDIKPANILLHDGEAVVADFGIALAVRAAGGERLTGTGFTVGTPQYMSPEQASADRELDARSDLYSLGCILYEMLAGEPPHTGPTVHAVLAKVISERPTSLGVVRDLPKYVEEAVNKALAKVPNDRFESCAEFSEALVRPLAQPRSPLSQVSLRVGSMLAAAVAAILLVVIAFVLLARRDGLVGTGGTESVTRQVTFTGTVTDVALAPDGQMIAYLTDGERALVVQDVASDQEVRLFESDTPLGPPRWSPTGTSVVLSAEMEDRYGLYSLPRLGGEARLVVELVRGAMGPRGAARRREFARMFGITAYDVVTSGNGYVVSCCAGRVFVVADGGSIHYVRPDSVAVTDGRPVDLRRAVLQVASLSVSPLGDWITFTGPSEEQQLVLGAAATDGSVTQVIMDLEQAGAGFNPGLRTSVRWPTPGEAIVVARQVGHGINLLTVPFDRRRGSVSGVASLLRSGLPLGASFDISLDRGRLVYAGGPSRSQLYLIEPTGAEAPITATQITRGTWQHAEPTVSWDGESVAYLKGSGTEWDVYWRSVSTESERRLTHSARPVGSLAWSPDGSQIAFAAENDADFALLVVDVETAETRRIGERSITPEVRPVWSPDGRILLYRSRPEEPRDPNSRLATGRGPASMIAIDMEAGAETEFSVAGLRGMANPLFSPDGESVVAFGGTGPGGADFGLWLVPIGNGQPRMLVDGMAVPVAWSDDGIVYFVRAIPGASGDARIEKVAVSGGSPQLHSELPERCGLRELAVSRQADTMVCAVAEVESDVWVVDQLH